MSDFDAGVRLVYLAAAVCFVVGLHLMGSPTSARRGNLLSAAGMAAAVLATFAVVAHEGTITNTGTIVLVLALLVGGAAGLVTARRVQMTAMPQLVSLFNAVGGGAAALVALDDFLRLSDGPGVPTRTGVATALDVGIGALTFAGSLVATGKLQGVVTGRPVVFPGARALNAALLLVAVAAGVVVVADDNVPLLLLLLAVGLVLGVTLVLPIGGADMPVVISLLNACTGTVVAMAGFVLENPVLIIAGALVGASGAILTVLMAQAMNRPIRNIVLGGFGGGGSVEVVASSSGLPVREVTADDVAMQLAYAEKVLIVPGYGLAAAQAQHEVSELAELLEARGTDVAYAIHPVAGRMPGHMNVLLAEADVPYPQLKEMDEVNPEFARTDVALVVGANDVTNPAARRAGTAISGMPILDVDQARSVIVIKRSMGHGYADIENELYTDPRTGMFFTDAKAGLATLVQSVKTLVG
ncbi:NAD(P)(+) transhydrogenase (Re/Si-specific) subunit beta [Motilibacter deserti]|uniref:NAD(P) transhydrogenase subunit beta n=1 Tax=Motilibacter deserti TaxID=2714956 RepID=A0ABX0GT85_9ACTN|nr:NAD(P)(+) transhydrogenase (Re/Si-specific) subunit beta [Motilibacter deserti]